MAKKDKKNKGQKISKKIQAQIDKLTVNKKGHVSFSLVGANAFTGNGRNFFKAAEFPADSGNYGFRNNIIVRKEYEALVDAAMKLVLPFIKEKHQDGIVNDDGSWRHNTSKMCYLTGNKNVSSSDEVYSGFEDAMYLKCNRSEKMKAPKVYRSPSRDLLKAIITEEGKLVLPDGVLEDGSHANFYVTIYPNPEYGSISCSTAQVVYRSDEFEPIGGETIDEEDEESLFEDPEADTFGEDDDDDSE